MTQLNNDQIAVMTIDYHLTKQAEPYTSIRAGVSMPVFVTPDDDLHAVFADNLEAIKRQVQNEVDTEFEMYRKPAPYSVDTRYQVAVVEAERVMAIVPFGVELPGSWKDAPVKMKGHRLEYIHRCLTLGNALYMGEFNNYTIYDEVTNESDLPELEYLVVETNYRIDLAVLVHHDNGIPPHIKDDGGWWSSLHRLGFTESNRLWAISRILEDHPKTTIIDCTDGDWSKLTAYYQQHAAGKLTKTPKETEPDEADYDDDTDNRDEDE